MRLTATALLLSLILPPPPVSQETPVPAEPSTRSRRTVPDAAAARSSTPTSPWTSRASSRASP